MSLIVLSLRLNAFLKITGIQKSSVLKSVKLSSSSKDEIWMRLALRHAQNAFREREVSIMLSNASFHNPNMFLL